MSNFQRRHYEDLAESISGSQIDMQTKKVVVDRLCVTLRRDNPAFNIEMFKAACGVVPC